MFPVCQHKKETQFTRNCLLNIALASILGHFLHVLSLLDFVLSVLLLASLREGPAPVFSSPSLPVQCLPPRGFPVPCPVSTLL